MPRRLQRPFYDAAAEHGAGLGCLSDGRAFASSGDSASGNPAFAISRGSHDAPALTPGPAAVLLACDCSVHLSDPGKPSDPRTFLQFVPAAPGIQQGASRRITGRPSPSLLRDPACGLSRRSRGPPRRGSGARAQQPCAVHAHDHPRASPATIAVAVDGYRTRWIVTGGTPRRCSAPRLDPRRSLVAFRGSGSRVVSRITIERFRLSSGPEARSAFTTVAARPREREPGALAGCCGSGW